MSKDREHTINERDVAITCVVEDIKIHVEFIHVFTMPGK